MHSDIIIIGAGPGGYETALEAARRGKSVTLFNGGELGGTCLNEGCIPTKCLCRDAQLVSDFRDADRFGIDDYTFTVDYHRIAERKRDVVSRLKEGISTMLEQAKVNVVPLRAVLAGKGKVRAGDTEYTADDIIIATGSESRSLPIAGAGLDKVLDSTAILNIDYIPESLVIIGGGVIGMEFASIFSSLGSKVTVVEYMKHILPPFDSDIAKRLKQILTRRGIEIITGASAKQIVESEGGMILAYELKGKEQTIESSDILMAVGRKPHVEGLGLETSGIHYSPKGIEVDENMQTNIEHVYAIGDVNGKMMLAHVATFQGLRALNHIEGKKDNIKFDLVPSAVFTNPECAMVGLTEDEAKERGIEIKIGKSFYRANGKALAMGEEEGICKLIFTKEEGLLIGAHIIGADAALLAQQACDFMNSGATAESISQTIFGHPTLSEILLAACHC